ncbi:winged helix-turn-helix transcriptional regulator [Thalassococcus sp. BH17M4-6]|uniref:winged helix-turn-helix transcriptional regulator n=1 Tax=Thalassococcus sp. BH17M4-6 TaxID=3413148 RepID=UPI003BE89C0D
MARKKPYDDGCATAHALDLIGERWALLVVRELMPGPLRFSDIKAALPGISSNILTTRLGELEAGHILRREVLPPPISVPVYALTDWGRELKPLIMQLGAWAVRSPTLRQGKPMSVASILMSFETMFDPAAAGQSDMTVQLVLEGRPFVARIANGTFTVQPGAAAQPDLCLTGDPTALASVIYSGVAPEQAEGVAVEGGTDSLARFAALFTLPEPWALE